MIHILGEVHNIGRNNHIRMMINDQNVNRETHTLFLESPALNGQRNFQPNDNLNMNEVPGLENNIAARFNELVQYAFARNVAVYLMDLSLAEINAQYDNLAGQNTPNGPFDPNAHNPQPFEYEKCALRNVAMANNILNIVNANGIGVDDDHRYLVLIGGNHLRPAIDNGDPNDWPENLPTGSLQNILVQGGVNQDLINVTDRNNDNQIVNINPPFI